MAEAKQGLVTQCIGKAEQSIDKRGQGGEQVRVRTSVYIDEKIIEIIRRQAEKENRSVSNLIEIILMDYCKKVEQSNEE